MFYRKLDKGKPVSNQPESRGAFFGTQAKLEVGKADDKFEKEADETADKVVKQSQTPSRQQSVVPQKEIQKKETPAQEETSSTTEEQEVQQKPLASSISSFVQKQESGEEETSIQTKNEDTAASDSATSTEQKLNSSKGGGRKMDDQTRGEMESGFGSDFSDVNIHTDSNAVQMNQELGAQAFTSGNDIYFNEGKYNPSSTEGKHLLAHELTHTIQQKGSNDPKRVSMKREPNARDKIQLAKFEISKAMLIAKREEVILDIEKKTERLIPQLEESLGRTDLSDDQRKGLEGHKQNRLKTWENEIKRIDDAIDFVEFEKKTYNLALQRVGKHGKIVWHSSSVTAGWMWEADSYTFHQMANSKLYQLGKRQGMYFAKLRQSGTSTEAAVAKVIGLGLMDLTGVSGIVEGISGHDIVTERKLSTSERVLKGVLGTISLVSLAAAAGPRISGWANSVGGTKFSLMRATNGTKIPVLVVAEGGAVIALSNAEIIALVTAGHLSSNVMLMASKGGGPKKPVSGLNESHWGKPRGGGGSAADKAYDKKVTGTDDAVYHKGVEFDGYNKPRNALLDAKRSKGKGSWYDIRGTSSFTLKVKIPSILKQARRQLAVLKSSGASKIEWHISNDMVAKQIRALFRKHGIDIIVKFTP